eukprot:s4305_g12.t1
MLRPWPRCFGCSESHACGVSAFPGRTTNADVLEILLALLDPDPAPLLRQSLPVTISPDQLQRLADEASRGHRGEVFAVKIARAHAALQGRDACNAEDLKEAIKLAILPRIRVQEANMQEEIEEEEPPPPPPPPPQPDMEDPEEMEPPPPQEHQEEDREEEDEPEQDEQDEEDQDPDVPEEFMIDPEGAVVDPDLLKFQSQQKKSGTGLDGFHMLSRVQCSGAVQGGSVISQMWRPFWRLQPTRVITGLFRHRHVVSLSHAGGRSGSRLVSGPLVLSPARSWVAPPTKAVLKEYQDMLALGREAKEYAAANTEDVGQMSQARAIGGLLRNPEVRESKKDKLITMLGWSDAVDIDLDSSEDAVEEQKDVQEQPNMPQIPEDRLLSFALHWRPGPATILCIALAASPSETVYYPLHCTLFRVLLASQEPKDVLEQPNMSQIAEDGPTCSCQLISTAWMVWPGQERADRAHGGSSNVAARSSLRFFLSCFIAGPAGCGGEHAAHGCSGEADPAGQVA